MTLHTDEDGYLSGFIRNAAEYYLRGGAHTQHPALNSGTAKLLVRECPEDAWRQHPASGLRVKREQTAAMAAGSVLDSLLTGPAWTGYNEGGVTHWNGLAILPVEDFRTKYARELKESAEQAGETPVKRKDFAAELAQLDEIRARLELAGVDMSAGERQTAVYWVERASDGSKVQCRGLLDQLILVEGYDESSCMPSHATIRDLKRVASLRGDRLARAVDDYGWHIQGAAYKRGVRLAFDQACAIGPVSTRFEWAFVRTEPAISVTSKVMGDSMNEVGELEWLLAVDRWAAGLKSGLWTGYEADNAPLEATPYMLARSEDARAQLDDAEAAQ